MRNLLCLTSAALGLVVSLSGIAQATSTSIYTSNNGTTTFPGQSVGTVGFEAGNINQFGNLSLFNNGSGGAFVNTVSNPSIYSFYYAGGFLLIQEQIGNDGHPEIPAIDVELDSLGSAGSTSPYAILASITIPFTSGPSGVYTVYNGYLAAGTYAIESYLAINNVIDPNYQINFTVPEPATVAVLSVGLIGLGYVSQRRRRGASATVGA